jgi:hypothetical protein
MKNAKQLVERSLGIGRRTARQGLRLGRWGASFARGQLRRITRSQAGPKPGMDDATLKAKVETELFRPADAPKSGVIVNVANGVVQLRGQVKAPEQVRGLEDHVRGIPEVRGVENLLHLPKTPPPTRTDTPATARRRAARSGGGSQQRVR